MAASEPYPEHEIKAAFIFNFMKFTEWPEHRMQDPNEPMFIFVVGDYPECKTFKDIRKKDINNRPVQVKIFKSFDKIKDPNILKSCHVLLICETEKKNAKKILKIINQNGVLTIGEFGGFLESGGMINFTMHDKKIRFEVNLQATRDSGLKLRSKLLKLAKRIINE
jgi:hypothetical protein